MYEHNKDRSLPYPQNLINAIGLGSVTEEKICTMLSSGLLDKREEDVIKRYYGKDESYPMIAKSYRVTKQRIAQITGIGLSKLRGRLKMESLVARVTGNAV